MAKVIVVVLIEELLPPGVEPPSSLVESLRLPHLIDELVVLYEELQTAEGLFLESQ